MRALLAALTGQPAVSTTSRCAALRGRSDHDLPSCWLRRLAAVVSGKRLACADPVGVMLILSPIEAIFEHPTW